ncbi:MAG: energy-coupling factor ABC transporter substrate-binding protein [Calditerrivibrio sp.]|nr:energy-coupling factor ABC transporter substrate-binding protein [Calditerrivibrio sp.]
MKKNLLLLIIAIGIIVLPLFYNFGKHTVEKFQGTDSLAEKQITAIAKDYTPWFTPIFEPPSGEVESLFFSLQSAIGAGIIGYIIGYLKGKKASESKTI